MLHLYHTLKDHLLKQHTGVELGSAQVEKLVLHVILPVPFLKGSLIGVQLGSTSRITYRSNRC